jgi:trigger factor
LKIEVQNLEGCKRRLDIQIPGSIVGGEIKRASAEMAKYARVPGFRPGRVPLSVIRQRFKSELRQEALRNLLPSAVETAVDEHKLRIIGEPGVETLDFASDDTLDVAVLVEVLPDFELKDYKGMAVTKTVYRVLDSDVDKVIEKMREDAAQLVAVDEEGRLATDGDFVSIDVVGHHVDVGEGHEGHHHEPLKADDLSIEIGGDGVHPEFNDALRGMKVGEEKTFTVTYPETGAPGMAGHTIEYTAKVVAIRVREVPDFNDEFASEQGEGEYDTAEKLRAAVRADLERSAESRTGSELEETVIAALTDANDFPVPEVLRAEQANSRMQQLVRAFQSRGIDPRGMSLDWASIRDSAFAGAERDVRAMLIIERIAASENLDPTDDEVEAEIQQMAEALGQPIEQLKARLTKEGGADSIRHRLRSRKALNYVIDTATVKVETVDGLEPKKVAGSAAPGPVEEGSAESESGS